MDPGEAFSATFFKWDPRGGSPLAVAGQPGVGGGGEHPHHPAAAASARPMMTTIGGGLLDFFHGYGVRKYTAEKMADMGFTVSTLVDMKDEEIDDMMSTLSHIFRWELLVGERYGVKAAVRARRRRLDDDDAASASAVRRRHLHHHQLPAPGATAADATALDALSQEGLSEEQVQQHEKEAAGSGGGELWDAVVERKKSHQQRRRKKAATLSSRSTGDDDYDDEEENGGGGGSSERQREHPFIVTEPGEVARGKKNGLDYLFHLYEQCREFLIQVQTLAKERGEKCPTKVTNQVFRYAKKAGASYINKPKMRHYVHCYALHCLDEDASNALRGAFKERGENVGAWRQACYKPLVDMAARQGWDIDAIFNTHPRLSIWYVPTKLRQLCHAERSNAAVGAALVNATRPLLECQP
uniref:Floricaula/leafy-like transcription factor n=27 Tax=Annonoideae TaxID=1927081 RepID=A0A0K1R7E4_ANNSQ|nr:LEAFY [Annona squamosa]